MKNALFLSLTILSIFVIPAVASKPSYASQQNAFAIPSLTLEWNKTYATPWNDSFQGIVCDSSGNAFVSGYENNSLKGSEAFIAKYDKDGNMEWNSSLNNYFFSSFGRIANDKYGNIYATGGELDNLTAKSKTLMIKYNSSSSELWNETWNNPKSNSLIGICIWNETSIYTAGIHDLSSHSDALLMKYDINGNETWNRTWDGGFQEGYSDVISSQSGKIYCVGARNKTTSPIINVLFQKYLPNGTLDFTRDWGGSINGDGANAVAIDKNENVYIVGTSRSYGSGGSDILILKYNSTGDLKWYRTWGGIQDDFGSDVVVNGSFVYVVGDVNSDTTILKYDLDGNLIWNYTRELPATDEHTKGIAIDGKGGIYVCGLFGWGTGISDAFIMKFTENKVPEFVSVILPTVTLMAIFIVITKRKRRDCEMPRTPKN